LRVANMATPCAPFHIQPVISMCSPLVLRPLTGLAVDWGNSVLYFTDGFQTIGWSYVYNPAGPSITFTPYSCCAAFPGDQLVGLAVRTKPPVPAGPPCAAGTCPACPMVHTASGDPNLGNASFSLDLNGAPAGSVAICALSLGSCMIPGTPFPGLCGPLWLPLPLWGTSPAQFPVGPGCGASTSFALPLPPNPAFAGLPIASQWLAFCPGGGSSMSNCLSFVLQGN
jgi:hypothetical protein